MGLGYTLFVKPLVVFALAAACLTGVYLFPEYIPDHAVARDAILQEDDDALALYLGRGLDPDDRAQWRSFPKRLMGRVSNSGVGDDMPDVGPSDESLLSVALGRCHMKAAQLLVNAGASVDVRGPDGASALHRAAACDDSGLVESLLARGADPNADEPDGGTPLWEPTNLGWRRRPFADPTVAALEQAGAVRPARAPVRQ